MSIFDVKHQQRAQELIQRGLASGRMPHAYIFCGPSGVGKEMMAVRLAGVLLCSQPRVVDRPQGRAGLAGASRWRDACGQCRDCRLMQAGAHPDLHLISKELHSYHPDPEVRRLKGLELSVQVIRQFLIRPAAERSSLGRAKVFIVLQADRMSQAAQNALLKTLEEPPAGTFIILLAETLHRLLPTTLSRCQHVPFAALPIEFVRQELVRRMRLRADEAQFLAAHNQGRLGPALQDAEDGLHELKRGLLGEWLGCSEARSVELAERIQTAASGLADRYGQRSAELSGAEANRLAVKAVLALLAGAYRDALVLANGWSEAMINKDQPELIGELAGRWGDSAGQIIGLIGQAEQQLDANANVQLTLENMIIEIWRRRQQSRSGGRLQRCGPTES